jgi:hypothetical protein
MRQKKWRWLVGYGSEIKPALLMKKAATSVAAAF